MLQSSIARYSSLFVGARYIRLGMPDRSGMSKWHRWVTSVIDVREPVVTNIVAGLLLMHKSWEIWS